MGFIKRWLAAAISVAAAIYFIDGIEAVGDSLAGPAVCALALALVNATVKPVLKFLSTPITILTLGIFYLVLNALMLQLASWISVEFTGVGIRIASFQAAFFGAIVISVVSLVATAIIGDE